MVGLAGEGQNFDGNGHVRALPARRRRPDGLDRHAAGDRDALFGNAIAKPLGTRPAFPGKRPPYKPDVPCYTNRLPDLNGRRPRAGRRPGTRAPRTAPSPGARR